MGTLPQQPLIALDDHNALHDTLLTPAAIARSAPGLACRAGRGPGAAATASATPAVRRYALAECNPCVANSRAAVFPSRSQSDTS